MSEVHSQERLFISKGTIIGFIIFGFILISYIFVTLFDLNIFTDRQSTAILGIAIILLLLGFIIDQLIHRGFNFWAFGAMISFFGVFIFFSPIVLYGINNNDTFLWLVLILVGFLLILFGYTVDAYELNNKLAKVLINLWEAIINFQWKQFFKGIFQLIVVFFGGLAAYIYKGFRQFRSVLSRFFKGSYNFTKIALKKTVDLFIDIPRMVIKTIKIFYSQSFWLLIPSGILLLILLATDTVSTLGYLPLLVNIFIIFIIAISSSNKERIERFTKVVINSSWGVMQTVSSTVQTAKVRLGRYKCTSCGTAIQLGQEKCSQCSSEVKSCTICKLPIKTEQPVTACKECNYPSHSNHWDQWIRMGRSCPVCHSK